MKPILYKIETGISWLGPIEFPSYFTMVAIGFLFILWLAKRESIKSNISHRNIIDLGLFMIIFGVIGARLQHVFADGQFWNYVYWCVDPEKVVWHITQIECRHYKGVWDSVERVCRPENKATDCLLWLKFWHGGLAFYGGFILASLFALWFIKKEKLPLGKVVDMAAWAIPFGLTWGRLGCFLNGCCFGTPSDLPWAVQFPKWSIAYYTHLERGWVTTSSSSSLPVHPAQLYEALMTFIIFILIYFWFQKRKKFDGELFIISSVLYAVVRFLIEVFRDDERGSISIFSTSQLISLIVILVCITIWFKLNNNFKSRQNQN